MKNSMFKRFLVNLAKISVLLASAIIIAGCGGTLPKIRPITGWPDIGYTVVPLPSADWTAGSILTIENGVVTKMGEVKAVGGAFSQDKETANGHRDVNSSSNYDLAMALSLLGAPAAGNLELANKKAVAFAIDWKDVKTDTVFLGDDAYNKAVANWLKAVKQPGVIKVGTSFYIIISSVKAKQVQSTISNAWTRKAGANIDATIKGAVSLKPTLTYTNDASANTVINQTFESRLVVSYLARPISISPGAAGQAILSVGKPENLSGLRHQP